jgi:hypothetical protein
VFVAARFLLALILSSRAYGVLKRAYYFRLPFTAYSCSQESAG